MSTPHVILSEAPVPLVLSSMCFLDEITCVMIVICDVSCLLYCGLLSFFKN